MLVPLYGTNAGSEQRVPGLRNFANHTPGGMVGVSTYLKENQMCRQVACKKCGKTTWAGCGQHVDQVMRGVKSADRCKGHEGEVSTKTGFFAKLFGR